MKMSVTDKEAYWDQHRDTLTKVRGVLTADKSKAKPSYRPLSNSHPLLTQKRSQPRKQRISPAGRHSRTPPSQLPRLQTPPEHDKLKQKSNLRTSKYEVVPPLKPRKNAYERTSVDDDADEDSWGEEDDAHPTPVLNYHPHQYTSFPAPMLSYPSLLYPAPGPHLVYPTASLPYVFQSPRQPATRQRFQRQKPTYPHMRRSDDLSEESESEAETEYDSDARYRNFRNKKNRHKPNKRKDKAAKPSARNGLRGDASHRADVVFPFIATQPLYAPDVSQVLDRYKYTYVNEKEGRRSKLENVASAFLDEYPDFSRRLVDDFIDDFLDDELIPDLLIDVVSKHNKLEVAHPNNNSRQRDHPLFPMSASIMENLVNHFVHDLMRDLVLEVVDENVSTYFMRKIEHSDPISDWLDVLVSEVVSEGALEVGGAAVREMAGVHMEKAITYDLLMEWVSEEIDANGEDIVREAVLDYIIDDIIEEELVLPEVEDVSDEVAVEVLDYYNDKARRRELKEVYDHGGDKLVDELCLDYLLNMLANQGRVLDQNAYADRFMDNMVLNILLDTFFDVHGDQHKTLDAHPLHKIHKKMVTDVALDAVLDDLCTSLDEDMADVDEYEQSIEKNSPMLGADR